MQKKNIDDFLNKKVTCLRKSVNKFYSENED